MPRLGCDTRIEKPAMDIVDRVFDLRNHVTWLKNVEFCLSGDQTDRLAKVKAERYDVEMFNNGLRKKLHTPSEKKIINNQVGKNMTTVKGIENLNDKRNRAMQVHNQLIFIHRSLNDQIDSLHDQTRIDHTDDKLIVAPVTQIQDSKNLTRQIREIQDRLTSVKLINKTLNTCKQHLQCDLDLLRKELPNVQKDIKQKFNQRKILKKEFMDIVAENKRRLKIYQQLLDHTEAQSRQRRVIHEQAMASVAEQLEDQYQVQIMAVNEMPSSFESRKLTGNTDLATNLQQKNLIMMNSNEIVQVRCMYDQFYNIIMAGFPIDITDSEQLKRIINEVSTKTTTILAMTNRLGEEKDQLHRQMNRTDKLLSLIEMSMNLKDDTRHKILDTMIEQRQNLELLYMNDTVDEQNRILRQVNDFVIVLSKALCDQGTTQLIIEPPIDFIDRLRYIFDLILKTVKTNPNATVEEDDRQISPIIREEISQRNSQIFKDSRSIDRSITSSLSSLSSRIKRN